MTCVNCIRSLAALSSKRPGDRWAALSGMERRRFAKVVDGLGRVFLMRNYRASLGKWLTADPMGYPDGWNQLAYCGNGVASSVDLWGAFSLTICDFNNPSTSISSADDLSIARNGDQPGTCKTQIGISLDEVNGTLSIFYYVGISISLNAITSASLVPGAHVHYTEHRSTPSDSQIDLWVYEAIEAHERGHAEYAINTTAEILRMKCSVLEVLWQAGVYSSRQVKDKVMEIRAATEFNGNTSSGALANIKTTNWFDRSSQWQREGYDGRVWEWVKIE